jgi:hypothetical protein
VLVSLPCGTPTHEAQTTKGTVNAGEIAVDFTRAYARA